VDQLPLLQSASGLRFAFASPGLCVRETQAAGGTAEKLSPANGSCWHSSLAPFGRASWWSRRYNSRSG